MTLSQTIKWTNWWAWHQGFRRGNRSNHCWPCPNCSRVAAASKELTVSDELQLEFQSSPTTSLISTLDLIANQFLWPPILISRPHLNFSLSLFFLFSLFLFLSTAAANKPCPFESLLWRNLYKVHHELCQCFPIVIMNGFKLIMGAIVSIISLLLTSLQGSLMKRRHSPILRVLSMNTICQENTRNLK